MSGRGLTVDEILAELERDFSESDGDIGDCGFSDNTDDDPDYVQEDLYSG